VGLLRIFPFCSQFGNYVGEDGYLSSIPSFYRIVDAYLFSCPPPSFLCTFALRNTPERVSPPCVVDFSLCLYFRFCRTHVQPRPLSSSFSFLRLEMFPFFASPQFPCSLILRSGEVFFRSPIECRVSRHNHALPTLWLVESLGLRGVGWCQGV